LKDSKPNTLASNENNHIMPNSIGSNRHNPEDIGNRISLRSIKSS